MSGQLAYPLPQRYPVPTGGEFGASRSAFGLAPHNGVDWEAPCSTPVLASGSGTVTRSSWEAQGGNVVEVDHGQGLVTQYAHLSRSLVRVGQAVAQGERIALSGRTGLAVTGCHLHFGVKLRGQWVDPVRALSGSVPVGSGGRPFQVYVPNGTPCPAGYHLLPNPSLGNPAGTDVCELPSNALQELSADPVAAILGPVGTIGANLAMIGIAGLLVWAGVRRILAP